MDPGSSTIFHDYDANAATPPPQFGNQTPNCDGVDYFTGVIDYIREMLMEDDDDLENRPCMFQDCSALLATLKYFDGALNHSQQSHPPSFTQVTTDVNPPDSTSVVADWPVHDDLIHTPTTSLEAAYSSAPGLIQSTNQLIARFEPIAVQVPPGGGRSDNDCDVIWGQQDSGRKKSARECDDSADEWSRRRNKLSSYAPEDDEDYSSPEMAKFDKSLLCRNMNPGFYTSVPDPEAEVAPPDSEDEDMKQYRKMTVVKRGRPKGTKKNDTRDTVVDLRGLLTRCAEAVSVADTATAQGLLKQIKQHCSPVGDPNERLAYCFANALEARLAGTGLALYAAIASRQIPAAELLASYQSYVQASPFKKMSNLFANKSIGRFAGGAARIHIIDFGILYGFQWPCIIQGFSLRPQGSPLLKITGIDFPQPGFKPAERVEQTGRRLMSYCKRFNVPFEYNAIAKRWDTISIEDLRIQRDEMVVVNCMYRLRHMPDESAGTKNSPRDAVLRLIRNINPDLFIHGVINGTYSAPFFATRFREALHHFTSYFDMLECTLPREDQDRLLYEREVFGRDVMNVVACEGTGRIERPETYKQWKARNQRAGFEQMPLNQGILAEVKAKVRRDYHSYFLLDEDSGWMLQGWKGRVMYALSCWKPSNYLN